MTFARLCEAYQEEVPQPPDIPDDQCGELLDVFWALSTRRPEGYASVRPLTFSEIDAWARLMRREIHPTAAAALLHLDAMFLEACKDVREDQKAREE